MNVLSIQLFEVILFRIINKVLNMDMFDIAYFLLSLMLVFLLLLVLLLIIEKLREMLFIDSEYRSTIYEDDSKE